MKKETMTSRERVMKTIEHKPVDRVPIDLGMHFSTSISAFAYTNLRRYLNLPCESVEVVDNGQFLARVEEDVMKRFHVDCMLLHTGFKNTQLWNPRDDYIFKVPAGIKYEQKQDGEWIARSAADGSGYLRLPAGGFFWDGSGFSIKDRESAEAEKALAQEAERIYKETDYYTVYMGYSGYFRDNPDFLCDMLLNPDEIKENNEKTLQREIERAGKNIKLLGKNIQAVCVSEDLGTQSAPFCNPEQYAELCAPYHKKFMDFIHKNSDWKIFFHTCGAMEPMIPILIDCGVDILNPVQVSCSNMEPNNLKQKYGDKITFWGGGCDTQGAFSTGTQEEVKENVRELMRVFKPGGGFVFNQVHNVMGNVTPENIVAMLDTAYENAFYE